MQNMGMSVFLSIFVEGRLHLNNKKASFLYYLRFALSLLKIGCGLA